jgi:hypothetical protein
MHAGFNVPPDAGNLPVALALAKAGLPIFPARLTFNQKKGKWDKEPHIKGWQQEATTDEKKLRDWWSTWPQAVPGIELGRAGLILIDTDRHGREDGVENFAKLVAQHVPLPDHPIANTAGGGQHHYFKQWNRETFGNSQGALRGMEIDVRGKGGWAVAPGSVRPDGKRWAPAGLTAAYHENKIPLLPDWLAAMIRPRKPEVPAKPMNGAAPPEPGQNLQSGHVSDEEPQRKTHQNPENGGVSRLVWSAMEEAKVRAALALIPSDDRTTWFEVGAALHQTGWPGARALWDEWSQTTPGAFDEADQDKTWHSFDRPYSGKPKTLASLFHLAQANGYRPEHREPPELAVAFTFLGDVPAKAPRELIKKLLPAEGVAITGGQPSAGKTFIEIHKAVCLATTHPFFGHQIIERVGTVFVAAEGRPLLPNRFAAALAKASITEKLPIAWINQLPDLTSVDGFRLFIAQLKAMDQRFADVFGTRLGQITVDTIGASFSMKSEDDNAEATKVCNIMRAIGNETGAVMTAVHHYGKNPESGLRGASAWRGSADIILGVLADIDQLSGRASNRELVCVKARDGEQEPISPFDLEFIELGLDADGAIYGSCCVLPSKGASRFGKTAKPAKGQRIIQDAINETLDSFGKIIVPRAGMPSVKAVKVNDVRADFDRRYVIDEADPLKAINAKRMAFKRALDRLPPSQFGAGSSEGTDWIWKIT